MFGSLKTSRFALPSSQLFPCQDLPPHLHSPFPARDESTCFDKLNYILKHILVQNLLVAPWLFGFLRIKDVFSYFSWFLFQATSGETKTKAQTDTKALNMQLPFASLIVIFTRVMIFVNCSRKHSYYYLILLVFFCDSLFMTTDDIQLLVGAQQSY